MDLYLLSDEVRKVMVMQTGMRMKQFSLCDYNCSTFHKIVCNSKQITTIKVYLCKQ